MEKLQVSERVLKRAKVYYEEEYVDYVVSSMQEFRYGEGVKGLVVKGVYDLDLIVLYIIDEVLGGIRDCYTKSELERKVKRAVSSRLGKELSYEMSVDYLFKEGYAWLGDNWGLDHLEDKYSNEGIEYLVGVFEEFTDLIMFMNRVEDGK